MARPGTTSAERAWSGMSVLKSLAVTRITVSATSVATSMPSVAAGSSAATKLEGRRLRVGTGLIHDQGAAALVRHFLVS